MLTIDKMNELGAKTSEGLGRCLNNEAFYLNLVKMGLNDEGFSKLEEVLKSNDIEKGFEIAHALKGVLGNLALTPVYDAICEITEELRAKKQMDYTPLLNKIKENREKFTKEL
jgi:hypothetical protein